MTCCLHGVYIPEITDCFGTRSMFPTELLRVGQELVGYQFVYVDGDAAIHRNSFVIADASDGALTVTLPPVSAGMKVIVKKVDDVGDVTISAHGSDQIDGSGSFVLDEQHASATLVSDGITWFAVLGGGGGGGGSTTQITIGGAAAFPMEFSTTTADANPGNGVVRLNESDQNTADILRINHLDDNGANWQSEINNFAPGLGTDYTGIVRLTHATDSTKFIAWRVNLVLPDASYTNVVGDVIASSATSPFADGDPLILQYVRNGEKGEAGNDGNDAEDSLIVLDSDLTIYVATSGNDSTGDGTSGAPFLTINRAVEEATKYAPAGTASITIDVAPGHYTHSEVLEWSWPYGTALSINGAFTNINSQSFSNFDTGTVSESSNLQSYEFDITLSSGTPVVGDFILVRSSTGGTNPTATLGLHPIVDVAGSVATVQVFQRDGVSALPSGSITGDITLIQSVVTNTTTGAISLQASVLGNLSGVVFVGPSSAASLTGLLLVDGASLEGANFGFHSYGTGVFVDRAASFRATGHVGVSKIGGANGGVTVRDVSYGLINSGSVVSGCSIRAVRSQRGANLAIVASSVISSFQFVEANLSSAVQIIGAANIIAHSGPSSTAALEATTDGAIFLTTDSNLIDLTVPRNVATGGRIIIGSTQHWSNAVVTASATAFNNIVEVQASSNPQDVIVLKEAGGDTVAACRITGTPGFAFSMAAGQVFQIVTDGTNHMQVGASVISTQNAPTILNSNALNHQTTIRGNGTNNLFVVSANLNAVQIGGASAATIADFRPTRIVFNEAADDIDFRVEGETAAALLFCDASIDRVSFAGPISAPGNVAYIQPDRIVFNEAGADVDFRVEGDTEANLFICDAGLDSVRIGGGGVAGTVADFRQSIIVFNEHAIDIDFRVESENIVNLLLCDASADLIAFQNSRVRFGTSEAVINEFAVDYDFRAEGTSSANLFVCDAGLNSVQIGGATAATIADFRPAEIVMNRAKEVNTFRVAGNQLTYAIHVHAHATTENIVFLRNTFPNFQGMNGGFAIGTADTAPTGNPAGGVFLYVDPADTELKVRNPSGDVTQLSGGGASVYHFIAGYGAGTNYTVTTSSAEVSRGTTDSAIVIDEVGTYELGGKVIFRANLLNYNAATTITLKLRRTNNTAADVANTEQTFEAYQNSGSAQHQSGGFEISLPTVQYTTANTDDRLAWFVEMSNATSNGTLEIQQDSLFARRVAI